MDRAPGSLTHTSGIDALPALLPGNLSQSLDPPSAQVGFEPFGVEATLQHDHVRFLAQNVRDPWERSAMARVSSTRSEKTCAATSAKVTA